MASMTGDAWQVREAQRQELLQGLMDEAFRAEEESGDSTGSFMIGLAVELTTRFAISQPSLGDGTLPWDKFLEEVVRLRVREFARSNEEHLALMAKFLGKYVLPDALSKYHAALSQQEVENPQLIFHAKHTTDEVRIQVD